MQLWFIVMKLDAVVKEEHHTIFQYWKGNTVLAVSFSFEKRRDSMINMTNYWDYSFRPRRERRIRLLKIFWLEEVRREVLREST